MVSIPYLPNPKDFSYSVAYCISENGQVLLMFEFDLVLYDPKDQPFKYPRIEGGKASSLQRNNKVEAKKNHNSKLVGMPHTNIRTEKQSCVPMLLIIAEVVL
ncbi:F-box/kelch-repeat protein [Senna tora]|uniref:F-box/kelch-repeat protein n=1 Tax=Senna tora TaxID=362788 RepID=A0A834SQD8_9FABA|nr:F-box/kelch-repeat protein [Senna tora]